jgi:hypothetical protein
MVIDRGHGGGERRQRLIRLLGRLGLISNAGLLQFEDGEGHGLLLNLKLKWCVAGKLRKEQASP